MNLYYVCVAPQSKKSFHGVLAPTSYNAQLDLMEVGHVDIAISDPQVHWTVRDYDVPDAPPAQFIQQPSKLELGSPFPGVPVCYPSQLTFTIMNPSQLAFRPQQ